VTVVVAARCRDGVVLASDSQASDPLSNVRWPVQKVFSLGETIVWGATGQTSIIDDMKAALDNSAEMVCQSPRPDRSFRSLVQPILDDAYKKWLNPPAMQATSPATRLVMCGMNIQGEPFIGEVEHNGSASILPRDWHAIGSAAGAAETAGALLQHLGLASRSVAHGTLIVFRALEAAISTSMFGVGGPIQMWQVTSDGCRCLTQVDVDRQRELLAGWQELEQDALDRLSVEDAGEQDGPVSAPLPAEVDSEGSETSNA
jgi:proteasome beta subunit